MGIVRSVLGFGLGAWAIASSVPAEAAMMTVPRRAQRPAALECSSPEANALARRFSILKFNTEVPELTDLDARTEILIPGPVVTELCATDGCATSYCFAFFSSDLERAAQGDLPTVRALMTYVNSQTPGTAQETATAFCKVKKP